MGKLRTMGKLLELMACNKEICGTLESQLRDLPQNEVPCTAILMSRNLCFLNLVKLKGLKDCGACHTLSYDLVKEIRRGRYGQ